MRSAPSLAFVLCAAVACGDSDGGDGDADVRTDADTDADTDSGTRRGAGVRHRGLQVARAALPALWAAACSGPPAPPPRPRPPPRSAAPAPAPAPRGPLVCPGGWTSAPPACGRSLPPARCEYRRVPTAARMDVVDRAGLQIRGLRDSFDLDGSAALSRNGRVGFEARGSREGRWVRLQAFGEAGGLVVVRCEGDGEPDAAIDEILASADLLEAPSPPPDPEPPTWLAGLTPDPPLGPERPLGSRFLAGLSDAVRAADPGAVGTPPDAVDESGGTYRIACIPLHEAPTVADLLDRAAPVARDQGLQTGAVRLGSRAGNVTRSAAEVPSAVARPAKRPAPGKMPVVRIGLALAGVFRFAWAEGSERCVLRYETAPGARDVPSAIEALQARLPEVVRVVASLRAR